VVLDHGQQGLGREARCDVVGCDAVLLVARDARLGALDEAQDEGLPFLGQVLAARARELGGQQQQPGVVVDQRDDAGQRRAQLATRIAVAVQVRARREVHLAEALLDEAVDDRALVGEVEVDGRP
jgi:hypothetical protein